MMNLLILEFVGVEVNQSGQPCAPTFGVLLQLPQHFRAPVVQFVACRQ
jgi:hypothetical protein